MKLKGGGGGGGAWIFLFFSVVLEKKHNSFILHLFFMFICQKIGNLTL